MYILQVLVRISEWADKKESLHDRDRSNREASKTKKQSG